MKSFKSLIKSLCLILLVFGAFYSQNVQAFMVNAQAIVTTNQVQTTFCNNSYNVPMRCQAVAYGQVNTGLWIHEAVDLYLMPGQCEFAYVYATYPFYFVNGYGVGNCLLAY